MELMTCSSRSIFDVVHLPQSVFRGELLHQDPVPSLDESVPVDCQRLQLLKDYECAWHVLCDILSHGGLSRGWMILFGSFRLSTEITTPLLPLCAGCTFLRFSDPVLLLEGPPPRQFAFQVCLTRLYNFPVSSREGDTPSCIM